MSDDRRLFKGFRDRLGGFYDLWLKPPKMHKDILLVDGWLTIDEGMALHDLASRSEHPIVEIGSWMGRSTIFLAKGSAKGEGQPIHAIDTFNGSSEHQNILRGGTTYHMFVQNLRRGNVHDQVIVHRGSSNDVVDEIEGPIGLLFIDGSHEYEQVLRDFQNYAPKVADGGIMARLSHLGRCLPGGR